MAAWRRAIELSLGDADVEKLRSIAQSRTEPASRVERSRILLGYWKDSSFFAVGQALGLHHQTVQRCVERAVAEGQMLALDDRPRPGREPKITVEAKAWVTALACRKAKDLGYPHELWTTRLLARHAREHGPADGHACLAYVGQGTVCKILDQEEVNPHKVRYYLECRDPEFAEKMAEVLCVYRKVKVLKKAAALSKTKPSDRVAIISYDEKPGIQAIATTSRDLPPKPGVHATFARDHEYKRHGSRGNHRAAGVRASAAGSSPAGLAGGPQGRILREGQCPHPLRRDRLRLPTAGDARRRLELAHDQLADRGDQHPGGVQERLPRDHHGPAQRHQRRVHRPGPGRQSVGRLCRRPARRDGPSRHPPVLFLRQLYRRPVRDEAVGARAAARRRGDPEPAGRTPAG